MIARDLLFPTNKKPYLLDGLKCVLLRVEFAWFNCTPSILLNVKIEMPVRFFSNSKYLKTFETIKTRRDREKFSFNE